MASGEPINVVILGGGKGGTALIELFTSSAGVKVVGVADINPEAPGLQLARFLNIPTSTDAASLISRNGADLIVDVTGDPGMASLIAEHKTSEAESLSGIAARLVWSLIQEEQKLREQLVHAEKLATLGTLAASVAHEVNNPLTGFSDSPSLSSRRRRLWSSLGHCQKPDHVFACELPGRTGQDGDS